MPAHVIRRSDGRADGEHWTENHHDLPGGAAVSLIFESTPHAGEGPRLHLHPYAETFVIRRGGAEFTVGDDRVVATAGSIVVVPANTPHKFVTLAGGYEAVHIHAASSFATTWLE